MDNEAKTTGITHYETSFFEVLSVFGGFAMFAGVWYGWEKSNNLFYKELGEVCLFSSLAHLSIFILRVVFGKGNIKNKITTKGRVVLKSFILTIIIPIVTTCLGKGCFDYYIGFINTDFFYNLKSFFNGFLPTTKR